VSCIDKVFEGVDDPVTLPETEILPRRVLVVAYYFPPMGMSGVQRTLKFVKYLPQFGWLPTVLTVEPRGYLARDESLLEELEGKEARIVRTPAAGPGRVYSKKEIVELPSERTRKMLSRISDTVFIPDNKIGWKRRAVQTALALHAETPFDLVFATAPPFTDFLIAAEIKKRINRPLVFDYRDPWADNPLNWYPTPLNKVAHVALERRALRASSHVITTNRRVKELILQRYKFLTYHDIDIIPQGFDPEDFRIEENAVPPAQKRGGRSKLSKMRVTYAGVFWEDRVPDYFLQALHDLFEQKPKLRGRIEATFIGTFREENKRLVTKLGLQDTVNDLGYLPHSKCVRELMSSDLLWMIVGDDVGSPGKVYEYIGARKPILGCAPKGFIRNAILEAGGTVVPPKDVGAIREALERYFEQFERNQLAGPPEDVVKKYDRIALTGSLVKLFESLLAV
jgi:glycosyltransferase involved in cell wall biosynthesis